MVDARLDRRLQPDDRQRRRRLVAPVHFPGEALSVLRFNRDYAIDGAESRYLEFVWATTEAELLAVADVAAGCLGYADDTQAWYGYDGASWTSLAAGGGGGGAPTTADYLVKTADAGLSAERVVTDTTSIAWDWATAGQAKAGIAAGGVSTTMLAANIVTFAKLQQLTSDRLVGRDTAGTGDAEQLTVGGGLEFTGAGGIQRSALTGDVTASAGSGTTAIASNAVTYAQMQDISAQYRLLGRVSSGAGDPEEVVLDTDGTLAANSDSRVATQKAVKTYLALASNLPAHASRHQHGGADEVATATPAANAIPKAGAGGKLDNGWLRPYSPILDYKPGTADTPDDDFAASTPDAKWTVVLGASGSVNILETGTTVSRYDLTTRPGWLLMQAGLNSGQAVQWRQTYTLPDGNSLIAAVTYGMTQGSNASAGTAINNSCQIGLQLSSTDTISSGTYFEIANDAQGTAAPRIIVQGSTGGITDVGPDNKVDGRMVFLRVARSSLTYYFFISADGVTWQPIANRTAGAALTRFHIYVQCNGSGTTMVPIVAWKFVRLGSNNLDPW